MAVTNMTNDQFAILKNYTKFLTDSGNGYLDNNESPTAAALDLFRDRANGIITTAARGAPDLDATYLMDLEYRMVELMIDEEQGRATEEGRPQYIPRDYMFQRDRDKIASSGATGFTRGTSS